MNTRDNLLKILGDLEQAGDKEDTLYSNIVKRLNKVLNNYLEELDSNLIDTGEDGIKAVNYNAALSKMIAVLIKKTKEHLRT